MSKCKECSVRLNEDWANICETCAGVDAAGAELATEVLRILTPYLNESRFGIKR